MKAALKTAPTDTITLPRETAMALLEHMRGWRTGAEAVLADLDADGRDYRELGRVHTNYI